MFVVVRFNYCWLFVGVCCCVLIVNGCLLRFFCVCSWFVVCRSMIVVARWLSFVACGLSLGVLAVCCLFVVWCLSFVVSLFVLCCACRCMLCVVCSSCFCFMCSLVVVRCSLFVAGCLLCFAWGNVV